jgi:hypothetical protein
MTPCKYRNQLDVIPTPVGDVRTTWPQGTSNRTEASERDRAMNAPENSPGTETTASDNIPGVEPDKLTDHNQALVTPDAIQPQMT